VQLPCLRLLHFLHDQLIYVVHFSQEVTACRGQDAVVEDYAPGTHQGALSLGALRQPDGSAPGGEVLVVGAGVTASKISLLLQSCLTTSPEDSRVRPAAIHAVATQPCGTIEGHC
jgi:hypothetical protein